MEHKFSIAWIRLVEAHFALNREYKWEKDKPIELQHGIDIGYKTSGKLLDVMVTLSSDFNNQPFRFAVSWEGRFEFGSIPQKMRLNALPT